MPRLGYHVCVVEGCPNEVPPKRHKLGYDKCIQHGERKKQYTVAPAFNKGGLQLITKRDVRDIGR